MSITRLKYIGQAISYPLAISDGKPTYSVGVQNIEESIYDILSTPLGSRFMLPQYGSRLTENLFEPNDAVLATLLENDIVDALNMWEKRINNISIDFEFTDVRVNCTIKYNIIQSAQEAAMIYPFYRQILT